MKQFRPVREGLVRVNNGAGLFIPIGNESEKEIAFLSAKLLTMPWHSTRGEEGEEEMKIFAAMKEDAHQGWVWLQDSSLPARSVIKITNPLNRKTIHCETLQIEDNFLFLYNQFPRISISKPDSTIVIGRWYRASLGGLNTQEDIPLTIKPCNSVWGRLMACIDHPQTVVRVTVWLGIVSVGLGLIGAVLGVLSFCDGSWIRIGCLGTGIYTRRHTRG